MKSRQAREYHNPALRPAIIATIAASFLMLAFGLSHRVLAFRLAAPTATIPIAPDLVEQLPMHIADWVGEDVPLDEAVVRKTGTDAHINRHYSRLNGSESISLYVACGIDARALMSHRPEVCYSAGGWALVDRHSMELPLGTGTELPCNVFEFTRGGLDTKKVAVLNYFIVDGQYCGDISFLRSRAWDNFRKVGYVVQVQIAASTDNLSDDLATKLVCDFAAESASAMAWLIGAIDEARKADSVRLVRDKGDHP